MKPAFFVILQLAAIASIPAAGWGQEATLHGQASAWNVFSSDDAVSDQWGIRYIPDLTIQQDLGGGIGCEADLSVNGYALWSLSQDRHSAHDGTLKPYRAWIRIATSSLEIRAGLQKINFGSALIFRPLMWFDRIDPRDPLQLTDGVYGLLGRYFFLDNVNVWLWGLAGNDQTKGWETAPTARRTVEYGGRFQVPLWTGETAFSYHHRKADLGSSVVHADMHTGGVAPEDRFAFDGKWDLGIGAWFEAVLSHSISGMPEMDFQRQYTLGADYTFDVGAGLYACTEYFRLDNADRPLGPGNGVGFSALSANYPVGLLDKVSAIVYHDWTNGDWYRLVTYQRTYDNWIIYVLGFWNPGTIALFQSQQGNNPLAGTGIQLMVVFNH